MFICENYERIPYTNYIILVPDIARTSPTSFDVKLNPPYILSLTAQSENIWGKRVTIISKKFRENCEDAPVKTGHFTSV